VKPKNSVSLQLSIRSAVELLAQQSPEAESLLYFLSLLPSGVKIEQLNSMLNTNVSPQMEIIQIYEFLDVGFGDKFVV
jgi:hypothetical protein